MTTRTGGAFGGRNPFGLAYPLRDPEDEVGSDATSDGREPFGGDNLGDVFAQQQGMTAPKDSPPPEPEKPAAPPAQKQAAPDAGPDEPAPADQPSEPQDAAAETPPAEPAAPPEPQKPDPVVQLLTAVQQQNALMMQSQQAFQQQWMHQQQVQAEFLQQQQARRAAEEQARQLEASKPRDPDWNDPADVQRWTREMIDWQTDQRVRSVTSSYDEKFAAFEKRFDEQKQQAAAQQRSQIESYLNSTVESLKQDQRFPFLRTTEGMEAFLETWWVANAQAGKPVDPVETAIKVQRRYAAMTTGVAKTTERDAQKKLDEQKRLVQQGKPVGATIRSSTTGNKPSGARTPEQVLEQVQRERNINWWDTPALKAD